MQARERTYAVFLPFIDPVKEKPVLVWPTPFPVWVIGNAVKGHDNGLDSSENRT